MSPRLLVNISSVYTDPNRVIMEPVDNSIDDIPLQNTLLTSIGNEAEYEQDIEIKVHIFGRTHWKGKVIISDNCSGIEKLSHVVESIGSSEKKSQSWSNGQFGYGIYSSFAICDTLEILTKHKDNSYSEHIIIKRDDFLIDDLSKLNFEIEQVTPHTPLSGTEVTLSGFSKESWLDIDAKLLKSEIENHFELLLQNPHISIKIKDNDGKTHVCKPYDYNLDPGVIFEKVIPIQVPDTNNKFDKYLKKNEIKIFLKINPKVSVERPPVIISKNRRVIELYQIKSLRTYNKRELWNNPSIEGYVNTYDLLNPTLARNDFKNDKNFRLVKKAILDTEPEILEKFRKAVENTTTNDFSEIESKFNSNFQNLIELTEEDKDELKPGDLVKVSDAGTRLIEVLLPKSDGSTTSDINQHSTKGKGEGEEGKKTLDDSEKQTIKMEQVREFILPPKGNQQNLLLKIDDSSDPIKDIEGKEKRSELFGNIVTIYKKHPDFVKRINTNNVGVELITTELVSYISSEMLLHFTNYSFEQPGKDKTTDRKGILMFFTDWLYRLEDSLKNLIGKPLSK
jgi:hypothetical protein